MARYGRYYSRRYRRRWRKYYKNYFPKQPRFKTGTNTVRLCFPFEDVYAINIPPNYQYRVCQPISWSTQLFANNITSFSLFDNHKAAAFLELFQEVRLYAMSVTWGGLVFNNANGIGVNIMYRIDRNATADETGQLYANNEDAVGREIMESSSMRSFSLSSGDTNARYIYLKPSTAKERAFISTDFTNIANDFIGLSDMKDEYNSFNPRIDWCIKMGLGMDVATTVRVPVKVRYYIEFKNSK